MNEHKVYSILCRHSIELIYLVGGTLNWAWDENTWGMRKCIKLHSSIRSFCSGVPKMQSTTCQMMFEFTIHVIIICDAVGK